MNLKLNNSKNVLMPDIKKLSRNSLKRIKEDLGMSKMKRGMQKY